MATMNEAIGAAIKQIEAARKPEDTVPWKPDTPHPQPLYVFSPTTQTWTPSPSVSASSAAPAVAKLALFTWNIDFMLPHGPSRMSAALAELHARIAALDPATAALVFLQECVAADLDLLGATDWVRAGFARTDVGNAAWASEMYGTTTLVDRRLGVRGVFRAHFGSTRMERDGLFVDVVFPGGRVGDGEGEKVVRLCNTHLESLAQEPPFRPPQVAVAARFMKEEGVHGALLAGDLNAIQPFDRTLHAANGLRDAYLALGGAEDSDEGYTWGQQAPPELRRLYGCSRMDKVWYCGRVAVTKFARFGADVEVADAGEREDIMRWGGFEKGWVTDHLGVWAEVVVE
ncbi:Endonuclease/exonuclease/phosphatase [Hypoxylon argillaceum]|nr:Endonuclease/exonuclease/phosphatase [Hypoxylon argillaceum]